MYCIVLLCWTLFFTVSNTKKNIPKIICSFFFPVVIYVIFDTGVKLNSWRDI